MSSEGKRRHEDTHHRANGTWRTRRSTRPLVSKLSLVSLGAVQTWEAAVALHPWQAGHARQATNTRRTNGTMGARGAVIAIVALKRSVVLVTAPREAHRLSMH